MTLPAYTGPTVKAAGDAITSADRNNIMSGVNQAIGAVYRRQPTRTAVGSARPHGAVFPWTGAAGSWVVTGTVGSSNNSSATQPLPGSTTSMEIVTSNTGANSLSTHSARASFNSTANPAFHLALWVWVSDPTKLSSLVFYVSSSSGNSYIYNVIAATPAADKPTLAAALWCKLTFGPGNYSSVQGAPVLTALNRVIMSVNDNSGGAVTVRLSNRMEWQPSARTMWPNGVVSIHFDDCYMSQITLGMPVLATYGYPANLVPITAQVGVGGNYTWADLKVLQDSLGCQVLTHCRYQNTPVAEHAGFTTLTAAQMIASVTGAREDIESHGLWGSEDFAYPNGAYGAGVTSGMIADYISPYVRSARCTSSQRRVETLPPWNMYQLAASSDVGGPSNGITNYTAVGGILDKVQASAGWASVTFHDIIASGTATTNQCTVADLQTFVDRCNTLGIAVATVGEVVESLR